MTVWARSVGTAVWCAVLASAGGCGSGNERPTERDTPAAAVTAFYTAAVQDGDYRRACHFAADGFYLRAAQVYGTNVRAGKEQGTRVRPRDLGPVTGRCPALALRIATRLRARMPFRYWHVERVTRDAPGRHARVDSADGSAWLALTGGEWRLVSVGGGD